MLKGRTTKLDRTLEKGLDDTYSQLEHYFALQEILKPKKPIIGLSGWAVMPDAGLLLVETILREKKETFVDIGSGASTVLAAYAMKKNGQGKVISIDHDKSYYEKTKKLINEHGLTKWVSLHYAPLKDQSINEKNHNWYDISKIKLEHVDMVFVDGPPHSTQDIARYPAVPLLYSALSDNAIIILDDYDRPDEQLIVKKWLDEFPDLEFEHIRTKKGVALITKS